MSLQEGGRERLEDPGIDQVGVTWNDDSSSHRKLQDSETKDWLLELSVGGSETLPTP